MKKQSLYDDRADLYDKIYAWKNYSAECDKLRGLLAREGIREGSRVLEAACGTGNYLTVLTSRYRVSGFDKSEAMLAIARRKLPLADLFAADMKTFEVAEPFDAVLCLFSSIGYLKTDDEIADAARAFARAVRPGGVIVVEPHASNPTGSCPTEGCFSRRDAEQEAVSSQADCAASAIGVVIPSWASSPMDSLPMSRPR